MIDLATLQNSLLTQLAFVSDNKIKLWWENYIKHGTSFRGVPLPQVRKSLKLWHKKKAIGRLTLDNQLERPFANFQLA